MSTEQISPPNAGETRDMTQAVRPSAIIGTRKGTTSAFTATPITDTSLKYWAVIGAAPSCAQNDTAMTPASRYVRALKPWATGPERESDKPLIWPRKGWNNGIRIRIVITVANESWKPI